MSGNLNSKLFKQTFREFLLRKDNKNFLVFKTNIRLLHPYPLQGHNTNNISFLIRKYDYIFTKIFHHNYTSK